MSWKAINTVIPWLPARPFVIDQRRVDELVHALRRSSFGCYVINVPAEVTEHSFLQIIGTALDFPEQYNASWDSYNDCIHDIINVAPVRKVVILKDSQNLLLANLPHLFARVTHLLCQTTEGVEISQGGAAQLEYVFAGYWSMAILNT